MEEKDPALAPRSRELARQKAELAAKGLYKCMGKCKGIYPLNDGIVTTWGGNVLLAICPTCFPETPMLIRRHPRGIEVKKLEDASAPADLVMAKDISEVSDFVSQDTVAKFKKVVY